MNLGETLLDLVDASVSLIQRPLQLLHAPLLFHGRDAVLLFQLEQLLAPVFVVLLPALHLNLQRVNRLLVLARSILSNTKFNQVLSCK